VVELDSGGTTGKMLKMTVDAIAPSVTALFNLSLRCNRSPKEWKRSNVVPIPKQKSKNPTTADFRLIIVQDFKEESQLLGHFL